MDVGLWQSMALAVKHLTLRSVTSMNLILQVDAQDDVDKTLPLQESVVALEAAWRGASPETAEAAGNEIAEHLALTLEPGTDKTLW